MLLAGNRDLANSRSETDARGTYPFHVAAEFGQAGAARLLLEYGADVSLLDAENDAIAPCRAAFFGRPEVVAVLLDAAVGGTQSRWKQFSNASLEGWGRVAAVIRSHGGVE